MHLYPLVGVVSLLALLVYAYMGVRVGQARGKYKIAAPAVTGHPDFERAYRIQMNTLEWLPTFLTSLWLFAIAWNDDRISSLIGLVWIVGRILYLTGYSAAPEKRETGFLIQTAAAAALLFGALGRLIWIAIQQGV
jgi:glutathione S-transferase